MVFLDRHFICILKKKIQQLLIAMFVDNQDKNGRVVVWVMRWTLIFFFLFLIL